MKLFRKPSVDRYYFDPDVESLTAFLFGEDNEDTQPIPTDNMFSGEDTDTQDHWAYIPESLEEHETYFDWTEEDILPVVETYGIFEEEEIIIEHVEEDKPLSVTFSSRPNLPEIPVKDERYKSDGAKYADVIEQYVSDAEFYSYGSGSSRGGFTPTTGKNSVSSLYEGAIMVDEESKNYVVLSPSAEPVEQEWDFGEFDEARERILNAEISVQSKILLLDALGRSL